MVISGDFPQVWTLTQPLSIQHRKPLPTGGGGGGGGAGPAARIILVEHVFIEQNTVNNLRFDQINIQ